MEGGRGKNDYEETRTRKNVLRRSAGSFRSYKYLTTAYKERISFFNTNVVGFKKSIL